MRTSPRLRWLLLSISFLLDPVFSEDGGFVPLTVLSHTTTVRTSSTATWPTPADPTHTQPVTKKDAPGGGGSVVPAVSVAPTLLKPHTVPEPSGSPTEQEHRTTAAVVGTSASSPTPPASTVASQTLPALAPPSPTDAAHENLFSTSPGATPSRSQAVSEPTGRGADRVGPSQAITPQPTQAVTTRGSPEPPMTFSSEDKGITTIGAKVTKDTTTGPGTGSHAHMVTTLSPKEGTKEEPKMNTEPAAVRKTGPPMTPAPTVQLEHRTPVAPTNKGASTLTPKQTTRIATTSIASITSSLSRTDPVTRTDPTRRTSVISPSRTRVKTFTIVFPTETKIVFPDEAEAIHMADVCRRLMHDWHNGSCTLTWHRDNERVEFDLVEIKGNVKPGVAAQLYEDITKKPTDNRTLIAILASCGALLIMIVILAVCASHHRKPYSHNQQQLTEELNTVENGYHDNPTLEVMEVQPEMQEKKLALNGDFNDSWIVPFDSLLKEEGPDEEDTHL